MWWVGASCLYAAVEYGNLERPVGYVQEREHEVPDPPVEYMQTGEHEVVELLGAAGWLCASRCTCKFE